MDHAVCAAREHHIGLAAANDFGRFTDRLAAGGTGSKTVDVGALGVEHTGQISGRHVGLLFEFGNRVEQFESRIDERLEAQVTLGHGGGHHLREPHEILLALAGAQIDTELHGLDGA